MQLTQDQVRAFVGPNADYYLKRWHSIHDESGWRALGFNWGACFLALSWLIYRRMYRAFWIVSGLWFSAIVLGALAFGVAVYSRSMLLLAVLGLAFMLLPFAIPITFGIYGTHWYYLHTRQQLSQLTPAGQQDLQVIGRIGGTNLTGAVVVGIILTFIAIWTRSAR